PLGALAGFAAAAQLDGASFREGVAVESLLREGDRVTGVRTASGDVGADRVLIATGCWSAALAATAAVPVPIWPYRRSIMQSGPVPQLARVPLTIEWESGFHFRPKGAAQRFAMPNITTDGKEEKGPVGAPTAVPGVAGLYIAAGFSGHGFMHAPATAQLVVEEMLDGRARSIDIRDLSLERFQTGRRPFKAAVL